MDELFLAYGKRDIVITSDGLPDHTGQIAAGTKDMMITTLSKLSERSQAFRFIDIEQGGAVNFIQNQVGRGFSMPDFYVRGAITQVDRNVMTDAQSAGVALPFASFGYSEDQLQSVVTIDMNIGDVVKRQIIPGLHTTNTITIVSKGKGADAEGIIQKASLFFEISQDRNQGTHQSVRTLIELGLIEVLGKLTKVPYWRCLDMNSTNPEVMQQAAHWYEGMTEDERIRAIQKGLKEAGAYHGSENGRMSVELRDALNQFKAQNDLIANGRIDFDVYYKLLADNRSVAPTGPTAVANQNQIDQGNGNTIVAATAPVATYAPVDKGGQTVDTAPAGRDPIGLRLTPLGGVSKSYRVGEEITFNIAVNKAANVYCYYEFVDGDVYKVARIFPNRWQSNGLVRSGQSVQVPGGDAQFSISPSVGGNEEQVSCIGISRPYPSGTEPILLSEDDLVPLSTAKRMFQVIDSHLAADRQHTSVQTVRWTVR